MLWRMEEQYQPASRPTVHVVEPDIATRQKLQSLFADAWLPVRLYADAESLLAELTPSSLGCVVTEVLLPGMDGFKLLEQLQGREARLPVVMLNESGDVPMAVRAMRGGAVDFFEKPCNDRVLLARIRQVLDIAAPPTDHRAFDSTE